MTNFYSPRRAAGLAISVFLLVGCSPKEATMPGETQDHAATVNAVADAYYAHVMATAPEAAYFSGIELERHDGLHNNSLVASAAGDAAIDASLDGTERLAGDVSQTDSDV